MVLTQELNFINTVLPLAGVMFIIAVGVVLLYQHFRKNIYKQMLEQQAMENKHQNELLRSTVEVQEAERKRIAQDMHDELGAVLSIARMQLIQLERQNPGSELSAALQEVRKTTDSALSTMRRLSHELMPPLLDSFGVIKTLESVRDQVNSTDEIIIELTASEDLPRWPVAIELALYRVTMELINNTIKHANAKQVRISIQQKSNQIQFGYIDDGRGLVSNNNGLGFRNMEARVNAVSGTMTAGNSPNGGFQASIQIPLQ